MSNISVSKQYLEVLLDSLKALIDTAARTTDLENVYCDKEDIDVSWDEIFAQYHHLKFLLGLYECPVPREDTRSWNAKLWVEHINEAGHWL